MHSRRVWAVLRYCCIYSISVFLLQYVVIQHPTRAAHIASQLGSSGALTMFSRLFVIQEILLLTVLAVVLLRMWKGVRPFTHHARHALRKRFVRYGRKYMRTYGIGLVVAYLVCNGVLTAIVQTFSLTIPGFNGEQMVATVLGGIVLTGWWEYVLFFLMIAVVAPLIEEVVYRGFVTDILMKQRQGRGVVVGAAIFALVHLEPGVMINLFILSLFLGYSYYKTRSLRYPLFFHCTINALGLVVLRTTA